MVFLPDTFTKNTKHKLLKLVKYRGKNNNNY
jgi:hypothetical protein